MEQNKKWPSCRLTVYGDSGRVRWCVGNESTWRCKIQILALIPLLLLTIISIPILFRVYLTNQELNETYIYASTDLAVPTNYNDNDISDNENRQILATIATSYIPVTPTNESINGTNHRQVRRDSFSIKNYNLNDLFLPKINITTKSDDDNFQWKALDNTANFHTRERSINNKTPADLLYWKNKITKEEVRSRQARIMLDYMNPTVNPCEDFYQFACGNWAKHNPIPPDNTEFDTFEILRGSLDAALRDLLVEDDDKTRVPNEDYTDQIGPLVKIKKYYKSCVNQEIINKRAEMPLLHLLDKLGGWPVLYDNWNETQFDWLWLLVQLKLYNNDILIAQWVGPDIEQSDVFIIQMDQASLGLPTREYYLEESNLKYLEAYRIFIITTANLLGAPILKATEEADIIINFEINLAKMLAAPDERHNLSEFYSRMTLGQLQAKIPQIEWLKYASMIYDNDVGPNEPILCFCLGYLQKLVNLLSSTPSRTIANYILWRFIRHRVNNLDERFVEAKQRFFYVLYGREEIPPRWQTCVSDINSNMGMALGHLFVKKYYDEKSKNDTIRMTKNIQNTFYSVLSDIDWLDKDTKTRALQKIKTMQLRIGYPNYILDIAELEKKYEDIEINEKLYFENSLSILQHISLADQMRLHTSVNKSGWNTPPGNVNAYYSRDKNQIMFPAGILQPPFYHRHFPRSLNYGGIGVVMGHEIIHGFDDKGRLFDKDGNMEKWWQDSSIAAFHLRARCLINQYNNYLVPDVGMYIDGINTQGENIADNGGIKQAFKAYMKWLKENPNADESMPGMKMTNEQLFFLNFAQVWCGETRPDALRNKLKTAVHSPGMFRVIGTVSNSPDFATVYKCPLGSPMNPELKCTIW